MTTLREQQSASYRKARDELLASEQALIEARERVAEARRALPEGLALDADYVFDEGPSDLQAEGPILQTPLSALFLPGQSELIVQHMMFAPDWEQGCPMCSMWADGLDGIVHHLTDRASFAMVARAPIEKLRAWGRRRGWKRLRLLSSHANDFNAALGCELGAERQLPGVSVFTRDGSGRVRHFYTSEGSLAERHHRHMDLYTPVWNLFDLLPSGRGDWMPKHSYHD